jgi:hypothetical protein
MPGTPHLPQKQARTASLIWAPLLRVANNNNKNNNNK